MKLKEEHKAYIVVGHAMYKPSWQILREFQEQFDMVIDSRRISDYHPDSANQRRAGVTKWRKLFDDTREKYLNTFNDIPIAQASFRLQRLSDMADDAFRNKNYKMAASLMEQAAKETGGQFSNVRELRGKVDVEHEMKDEPPTMNEMRNTLSDAVAEAVKNKTFQKPTKH